MDAKKNVRCHGAIAHGTRTCNRGGETNQGSRGSDTAEKEPGEWKKIRREVTGSRKEKRYAADQELEK